MDWSNKEDVLEAVQEHGTALRFASEELRNDKEVVLEAVKENGWSLEYASEELRNDKEVVLEAVKVNGVALEYASEELCNDKDVVLEAVKENGWALEYASEELRSNEDVVLEAVKENPNALLHASSKLQEGIDIVIKDSTKIKERDTPDYVSSVEEEKALKYLDEIELNYDDSFKYQMLGRMQMDCDVYLGNSPQSRNSERLWANTEQEQIEIMKNLYLSFPDDKKPEWISLETIQNYETQMLNKNDIIETQINQEEPEMEM